MFLLRMDPALLYDTECRPSSVGNLLFLSSHLATQHRFPSFLNQQSSEAETPSRHPKESFSHILLTIVYRQNLILSRNTERRLRSRLCRQSSITVPCHQSRFPNLFTQVLPWKPHNVIHLRPLPYYCPILDGQSVCLWAFVSGQ